MGRGGSRDESRGGSRGSHSGGHRSSGRASSGRSGKKGVCSKGASGTSEGRTYSSKTKSFISGKIAGQYRAKGYSKSHAQHIGSAVVGKMSKTFRSGSGSKRSYQAGLITGRYQSHYSAGRSTNIGNAVAYGSKKQRNAKSASFEIIHSTHNVNGYQPMQSTSHIEERAEQAFSRREEPITKYKKTYGKSYSKDYLKRYK